MNRSTLYVFEDSFKILDERFVRLEPWLFSFFFFFVSRRREEDQRSASISNQVNVLSFGNCAFDTPRSTFLHHAILGTSHHHPFVIPHNPPYCMRPCSPCSRIMNDTENLIWSINMIASKEAVNRTAETRVPFLLFNCNNPLWSDYCSGTVGAITLIEFV